MQQTIDPRQFRQERLEAAKKKYAAELRAFKPPKRSLQDLIDQFEETDFLGSIDEEIGPLNIGWGTFVEQASRRSGPWLPWVQVGQHSSIVGTSTFDKAEAERQAEALRDQVKQQIRSDRNVRAFFISQHRTWRRCTE